MDEEDFEDPQEFFGELMEEILKNEENLKARTIITTLLPSHQHTTLCRHKSTASQFANIARGIGKRDEIDSENYYLQNLVHPGGSSPSSEDKDYVGQMIMIKNLPVPMKVKMKYKEMLEDQLGVGFINFDAINLERKKAWKQFKEKLSEIATHLSIWHYSIKNIEGNFGTGIVSYFVFSRWLLMINLLLFAIMFGFIVLPHIIYTETQTVNKAQCSNNTVLLSSSDSSSCDREVCQCSYLNSLNNISKNSLNIAKDSLQGTGWMENTVIFFGGYESNIYNFTWNIFYNLPLAYILSTLAYLILSLILMLRVAAEGFQESIIISEGHLFNYCNIVFGGWDFCIMKPKYAASKHGMILTELKGCLENEKLLSAKKNRTTKDKIILYSIRFVINIIVLGLLGGCFYLIYRVSGYVMEQTEKSEANSLLVEYLPSITITLLNLIIPQIFSFLVSYENYTPIGVVQISLIRSVFLRLASIGVLLIFFQVQVLNEAKNCCSERKIKCWETYVGQQFYKLAVLDLVIPILMVFTVGCLRKLLVAKIFNNVKLFKMIGQEEFSIPDHVLDLIYSQTLCWLGSFFCPLLPLLNIVKCFIMFYVKKFHLFVNCIPSSHPYRASRSNSFFMIVLLLSFSFLCVVPIIYAMTMMQPSTICGPFQLLPSMWSAISQLVDEWPSIINDIISFLLTGSFAVTVIVIILLYIYYNYTLSSTYNKMSEVLKDYLIMEGRDKQFLLERLNDATKQPQRKTRFQEGRSSIHSETPL